MAQFSFDAEFTVFHSPELRKAWPDVAEHWRRMYEFFDDDDLRLAMSQPSAHFGEWLTAIYCHHAYGTHALLEKYQYKRHARKLEILEQLSPGAGNFLRRQPGGPPDLLVYRPDFSDWWFVEVKRGREPMTAQQPATFERVRMRLGQPIHRAVVRVAKG